MDRRPRAWQRVLLAATTAVAGLLLAEGAVSLLTGRSLRGHLPANWLERDRTRFVERGTLAADTPGLYQVHADPRVGLVLRANSSQHILEALTTSDALGLRTRPAPPPGEDAFRIVVLGDSVAFGYGVADHEVLAARIERSLAVARGAAATPPVACFTVALPGWNHRNAVSFLFDHFEQLRPDLVVYLPIPNDIADSYGVTGTGRQRLTHDLAQVDPWLRVDLELMSALRAHFGQRVAAGELALDEARSGPFALLSGVGRESSRRLDENAESVIELQERLGRVGVPLRVAMYNEEGFEGAYAWHLRRRWLQRGFDIPEIPLLERTPASYTLGEDPHPDARCLATLGSWIAGALLAEGLLSPGESLPLPATDRELEALRVPRRSAAEVHARVEQELLHARLLLRSRIDFESGEGFRQVLGGLNPDLTLGPRALFLLRGEGATVRLELAPLPGSRIIQPLTVQIEVDGQSAGTLQLGSEPVVLEVARPAPVILGEPIEVKLIAERWIATEFRGRQQVAPARIRSVSCDPP